MIKMTNIFYKPYIYKPTNEGIISIKNNSEENTLIRKYTVELKSGIIHIEGDHKSSHTKFIYINNKGVLLDGFIDIDGNIALKKWIKI